MTQTPKHHAIMSEQPRIARRRVAIMATAIGLAFVAYCFAWMGQAPYSGDDTSSYVNLALDLKDGSVDQLHMRTPGLPLFLLMTRSEGGPNRAFYIISLALHFLATGLLGCVLLWFKVP